MHQAKKLNVNESLDRIKLYDLLRKRIDAIDWEEAKKDISPFIADPNRINIWSKDLFHQAIEHLVIERHG